MVAYPTPAEPRRRTSRFQPTRADLDMLRAPDFAGVDMTVSAAPCLTGGSVAYLDGDAADWIHPGSELIPSRTGLPARPTTTPSGTSRRTERRSGGWSFGFSSLAMSTPLAVGRYDNSDGPRLGVARPRRPQHQRWRPDPAPRSPAGSIQSIAGGPVDGTYTELTATFEQHCSGLSGSLRGCVHFETQP